MKPQARSQVWLAGLYIVIAALLPLGPFQRQADPKGSATPEAQALTPQGPVKPTRAPKVTHTDVDILEKAKGMTSIAEFLQIPLSPQANSLVHRMNDDEFDQGSPFYSLNNVYPVALILHKGVRSFHREVFRSPEFLSGFGYDFVKYEITQDDGAISYILAYKEKTAPAQVAVGQADRRPIFSWFLVPQDQDQVYASLYQDGQPVTNGLMPRDQALNSMVSRIESATPLLSSREN